MTLKRSLAISFTRNGASFILQFAGNIALARLLLPSEIGVFSVSVAALAVLHSLRDFGVGRYLVKEKDLTDDKIRTVFASTLVIGWSLAALIFFSRDIVADFYSDPRIGQLLALLSINFLILPIGQPAMSLMRRERQYGRSASITLAASFLSIVISITLAFLGFGAFSMAYGAIASTALTSILALCFRPDHLFLKPSLKEWRAIWKFGALASAGGVVIQLGASAPELVIGRMLNFAAVGFYSRGMGLARMFENSFSGALGWVVGPEIGALHREGHGLAYLLTKATDLTLVVGWPFLAFLGFKANTMIWLFYGDNWLPAVPILQALCIARGIHLLVASAPAAYEGTGAVKLQLRNEIILQVANVALIAAGALHSIEAVAWLRVPFALLVVAVHWTVFNHYANLKTVPFLAGIWKSLLIAALFILLMALLVSLEPKAANEWEALAYIVIEALIMGTAYAVGIVVLRHPMLEHLPPMIRDRIPGMAGGKVQ